MVHVGGEDHILALQLGIGSLEPADRVHAVRPHDLRLTAQRRRPTLCGTASPNGVGECSWKLRGGDQSHRARKAVGVSKGRSLRSEEASDPVQIRVLGVDRENDRCGLTTGKKLAHAAERRAQRSRGRSHQSDTAQKIRLSIVGVDEHHRSFTLESLTGRDRDEIALRAEREPLAARSAQLQGLGRNRSQSNGRDRVALQIIVADPREQSEGAELRRHVPGGLLELRARGIASTHRVVSQRADAHPEVRVCDGGGGLVERQAFGPCLRTEGRGGQQGCQRADQDRDLAGESHVIRLQVGFASADVHAIRPVVPRERCSTR